MLALRMPTRLQIGQKPIRGLLPGSWPPKGDRSLGFVRSGQSPRSSQTYRKYVVQRTDWDFDAVQATVLSCLNMNGCALGVTEFRPAAVIELATTTYHRLRSGI